MYQNGGLPNTLKFDMKIHEELTNMKSDLKGDGLRYEFKEIARRINDKNYDTIEYNEAITRSKVFENFLSDR